LHDSMRERDDRTASNTSATRTRSRCAALRGRALLLVLGCFSAATLGAQEAPLRRPAFQAGGVWESWRFATPLPVDTERVERISQLSFPLGVVIPLGPRWTFDVSGAYAMGSVQLTDTTGARTRTIDLRGPTDVKLRLVGHIVGDALLLNLGLNAPTGLTRLGTEDVAALRLIGAPPLRMPSPTLGNGLGGTAGLVLAQQAGAWALAAGAAYEVRASYTPIDAAVAGIASTTELDPSDAVHLSLGADRLMGPHRLSFIASYDLYGKDQIALNSNGGAMLGGSYQLGPSVSGLMLLELGVPGMQELSLALVNRYRSRYNGLDGHSVDGSSGNQFDARLHARFGVPRRFGWWLGIDGHVDTGLDVDQSLATAAMSAVGGSLGLSLPLGAVALEPAIRASLGSVDTGARSSRATGLGASLTIVRR
ncbi:MAG: hypothetical protein ABI910_17140, partial [Gemmatimonadota bacterium]